MAELPSRDGDVLVHRSRDMNVEDQGRERILAIFLTDVEGSTQHWQRDPQRMSGALDVLA